MSAEQAPPRYAFSDKQDVLILVMHAKDTHTICT